MKIKYQMLTMAALAMMTICTGCATQYTSMVRITPSRPWDSRSAEALYRDLSATAPVPVPAGDFVVSAASDGPSCWVCLGDERKTDMLVKALKHDSNWKVTSVGQVLIASRPLFGLAPEPGSPTPGASNSRYVPAMVVSKL